jgi:uncharacterized protein (DUF608 family)
MATRRRDFLKSVPAAAVAAAQTPLTGPSAARPGWPRRFTGKALAQIAMPLGGVAAGSISLGGRGQLRDWEIFNRPDKGNEPAYAFASVWAQAASAKPVAMVAEARYLPPFEGQNGLGANNAPGLPRLRGGTFSASYPIARIDFTERRLPVKLSLEAFTPIIPLAEDDSGYPATVLRYIATNPGTVPVEVAVAFSIENPIGRGDTRTNEPMTASGLKGLLMANSKLAEDDPLQGSFALATPFAGEVTMWRGWPRNRWWNSPMLFWDEFSAKGRMGTDPAKPGPVGVVCLRATVAPGATVELPFILSWRIPNRTPERCHWTAPKGAEKTLIGNWHCGKYSNAWNAASEFASRLPELERRTKAFVQAVAEATMPPELKDAASANLSTLATQTVFRTLDGEFHGFEGSNDKAGCCFGSCTHVWNYESTTAHVFPVLSRSMRRLAFTHTLDNNGGMRFRLMLPAGREQFGFAATDGQMGQIMKAYLDWKLRGDDAWLRAIWPQVKRALEFSWIAGGWDADRDGVTEGVQHNTYDVEFYGPNPQCGIYYLGALRASAEMAQAMGDASFARTCSDLLARGAAWTDANLFNGEYYIQKIRGVDRSSVAPGLMSAMGSDDTRNPEYQMGEGCLVDQLIGQYQADVCGLGDLLDKARIRKSLESIYRYNFRRDLSAHENVQRTFAVSDESGLLVCDYGKKPRPSIPFPYYAEVWTGFEYSVAAQMIWAGMVDQGVEIIRSARLRHDGEKRNPFDEPECGHHYARAMSAWSPMLAWNGFDYSAPKRLLKIHPKRLPRIGPFKGFWSTGTGWGDFVWTRNSLELRVIEGRLAVDQLVHGGETVNLDAPVVAQPGKPLVWRRPAQA